MSPTTPKSYDEIVRSTVVEPDSSVRPTIAQEQAARDGFRALDGDEQVLQDRVSSALVETGATGVTVEISRDVVTLRGRVANTDLLRSVEEAVSRVPGIEAVHNKLVVGA